MVEMGYRKSVTRKYPLKTAEFVSRTDTEVGRASKDSVLVQQPQSCAPRNAHSFKSTANSNHCLLIEVGIPDKISASEGGHGKVDIVREVARIIV